MEFAITGIGLYNGLGKNARNSFSALLDGKSTFIPTEWPQDDSQLFPQTHKGVPVTLAGEVNQPDESENKPKFEKYWRHWDPVTRIGLLSADEAVTDSGIDSTNVGVIFSSFAAGSVVKMDMLAAFNQGKKYSPRKSLNIGGEHTAAQVAAVFGFNGPNYSMVSACATGIVSIDAACAYLKSNPDLDAMLVGATDRTADAFNMYWFNILGALSPTGMSAPFDKSRNGFVMGEGAATIIIEPLSKALKRGANVYATINGCGVVTKFDSDTSPDPEGEGAVQCMLAACKQAGLNPSFIDYVNAHATSTPVGDIIEYDAIAKIIKHDVVVVSNKGQIGHAMSACGLIETIYTLLTMKMGISPGNANLVDPIGDSNLILPTESIKVDVKYAMKNSFGFGGRNASMILERW
jgi:3-oxoacyl-[acyl-carrier-protein] synthase II